MNFEQAADAIRAHFHTRMAALEPGVLRTSTNATLTSEPVVGSTSWVDLSVEESFARKLTLGANAPQQVRGRIRVGIHTPWRRGDDVSRRIATNILTMWDTAHDNGLSSDIFLLETSFLVGNRDPQAQDWWVDTTSTVFWYYHDPA